MTANYSEKNRRRLLKKVECSKTCTTKLGAFLVFSLQNKRIPLQKPYQSLHVVRLVDLNHTLAVIADPVR
jgi:hypothetical protein